MVKNGGKFSDIAAPIVIDFSQANWVNLPGDQGAGKSTLEELLLLNLGAIGGAKVVEKLTNNDNGLLETSLTFTGNDKSEYEAIVKDGKLTLKRDGSKDTRGGAQELIRQVVGAVGVSPMTVKNADIDDQVKWLAGYSDRGADEYEKDIKKNKEGQKSEKKTRAEANKSVKGCREYLATEGYINKDGDLDEKKWKESETKYKKKVDIEEVSGRLKKSETDADKYLRAEEKLKGHKLRRPSEVTRITEIEKQLEAAKKVLDQTDKDIQTGEKYLVDNKEDKTKYDKVKKEFENVSQEVIDYNKWQDVKKKKAELDEFEDISQKADAKEKSLVKQQQELQWEIIPDIKGVEIILEDTHEDEGEQRKAGFYYKGLNSRQLSASEWFGLVVQILKKNKVKVMVIDDISQFGSTFIEELEKLVKSGAYILTSEMERGKDVVEIQYK